MRDKPPMAVLGFRPHTYWTAAVALAAPPDAPQVLERRRIVFAVGAERFVYHQAAALDLAAAEVLIEEVRAATRANAVREIGTLVEDLRRDEVAVALAVVPAGAAKPLEGLEQILQVHARIHAAEGRFYRDVVAAACAALGLEVQRPAERDLPALSDRLKPLGPPWNEDYRLAARAAWSALD